MAPRRGLAPAKVNLTLHVTGRRADGYHTLDSLVAFADIGDVVTVGAGDGLTVTGPFAEGVPTDDSNLIRRALVQAGLRAAVTLDKHLPHPGGIGGGSSDAATVLRLVGAALSPETVLALGADLPVCVHGRAARMSGIGEVVAPLDMPNLHAVLIHPGLTVPTPEAFRRLTTPDNPGHDGLPKSRDADEWLDWLQDQRNDLEAPAFDIAPGIAEVLDALRGAGAALARMSGSGATCFGLWPSRIAAEDAARALVRPGWWVRACSLA